MRFSPFKLHSVIHVIIFYACYAFADANVDHTDPDLAKMIDGNYSSLAPSFMDSCIPGKEQDDIRRVLVENIKSANFSEFPSLMDFVSTAQKKISNVRANITETGVTKVCQEFWGKEPDFELEQSAVFLDCLLQNVQFLEDTLVEEVLVRTKT